MAATVLLAHRVCDVSLLVESFVPIFILVMYKNITFPIFSTMRAAGRDGLAAT
jgi:hypothetical protein